MLAMEERSVFDALNRSTKAELRMRICAWVVLYPVHARIRKSLGEMIRKLSDTVSQ